MLIEAQAAEATSLNRENNELSESARVLSLVVAGGNMDASRTAAGSNARFSLDLPPVGDSSGVEVEAVEGSRWSSPSAEAGCGKAKLLLLLAPLEGSSLVL